MHYNILYNTYLCTKIYIFMYIKLKEKNKTLVSCLSKCKTYVPV